MVSSAIYIHQRGSIMLDDDDMKPAKTSWKWIWRRPALAAICGVALVAAVVAIAIATLFSRVSPSGSGNSTTPGGIRLEELKAAEEMFDLAGQKAVILKYSGGDVEFWVEIESQGKKEKCTLALAGFFDDKEKLPAPNQAVVGYFLWVRNEADAEGRETWRLACRRDLVAAERSGLQVWTPLGQASASHSREDRQSTQRFSSQPVQVWKAKNNGEIAALRSETGTIPNSLPAGREVCIKEIREKRMQPRRAIATAAASILGLSASPRDGLLVAAFALTSGKIDETIDLHTIKVMCKVTSRNL
jgi:hypothetical protein